MEDKRVVLIERINEGLQKIGKKPKPAAIAMGLSETAILDIIKGRSQNPKRNTLQILADGFGFSVEYLMGSESTQHPFDAYTKKFTDREKDSALAVLQAAMGFKDKK